VIIPLTIQETLQQWYKISRLSGEIFSAARVDIPIVSTRDVINTDDSTSSCPPWLKLALQHEVMVRSSDGLRFKVTYVGAFFFVEVWLGYPEGVD
jgi:hypothetical protein